MRHRETQRDRLLRYFKERRGEWIPLPEILALGIAQYSARIFELRRDGFRIENRTEHRDGRVLSWFRLAVPKGQQALFPEAERPAELAEVTW